MKSILFISTLFLLLSANAEAKKYNISKKVLKHCISEVKEMTEEEVISNRDYPDFMKFVRIKIKSVNESRKLITFFVVVKSAYSDLGEESVFTDKFIVINRYDKYYCEFLDIKKI